MKITINLTPVEQTRLPEVDLSNLTFGNVFTDHMFIADYKDGQWQDFRIEPLQPFMCHPANMALHYGQSLFEGMKAFVSETGTPLLFRPEMHARRLNESAERMCMPELPEEIFMEAVKQMVWLERAWIPTSVGSALYIRPFMFATDAFIGVAASKTYRFMIITLAVGPYYNKPVRLLADERHVRAAKGGTGEAKAAGNYAGSLLPARKARENGFDQVLWLDARYRKFVQEVGTMNIFFVVDGKVLTPLTDGAILKGITRDSIITLLRDKGYDVEVRPITIDELIDAYDAGLLQEVFGSGTAAVISHVSAIAYKDRLLEMDESGYEVSRMIKNEMNLLRTGAIADTRGWVAPVHQDESVLQFA